MPRTKSAFLHVRVDPELKTEIFDAARRRRIDASALVSLILGEWLARNHKAIELSEALSHPGTTNTSDEPK